MPPHLYGYVKKGITLEDVKWVIHSSYLSKILDRLTSPENYRSKFHYLLWIEEMQMRTDIHQYDLNDVTMDLVQNTGKMKLEVPGLAENRPSVLQGYHLYIYICCDGGKVNNKAAGEKLLVKVSNLSFELKCEGEDSEDRDVERNKRVRYEGIVHKTELHHVHLGVARKLQNSWMEGKRYNVEFTIPPFNMWVQHRAVENAIPFMDLLFPEKHDEGCKNPDIVLRPFFDKKLNSEQQTAVRNIVQGTSRPAPYIIFGPPGTGKTVTITEAIKQVYGGQNDSRILVCCPENTAADFLMRKLLKTGPVMKKDIFRMFAISRAYETVHPDIWNSDQHNYDHENTCFYYPTVDSLKQCRILVVTLMTSGRMVTGKFPKNHFTHIFIDEGGHAVEPECIVPITGLMDPTDKSGRAQLVISGDPQQLGPIIRSPISLNFGLAISHMERLMTDIEMYKTQPCDERYITKLIRNYRSHDSILEIPRRLFYNNELKACGDPVILNSMLDWEMLPNKKFPIIFHAVFGKDEQEETKLLKSINTLYHF
ncbi:putative helicase mov-10-B.1 [Dreissena polymorpha]|uniref:putative helicase mov-10-B.1 n=1 Tax=Dreissena polymorpha TaxID=45954 RepID=UPI002263E52D|nr:putative helicase mov-10-B.1 [Dreissena polymorpha]